MTFLNRHSKRYFARCECRVHAFALMEIMLALALFSMVSVALVSALNQIAQTSAGARREGQVLRVLQSVIAEVSHSPKLKKGKIDFAQSPDGVSAEVEVAELVLKNQQNILLSGMWVIKAEAWMDDPFIGRINRKIEVYVNQSSKQ